MSDPWLNSSPSKKAISKSPKPPLRSQFQDLINAWCIRPRITEPDGTITTTDKLIIYVRFDAAHPVPTRIDDLMDQLNSVQLSTAELQTLERGDQQILLTIWRPVDARRSWGMLKVFFGADKIRDITNRGTRSIADWAEFQSHKCAIKMTVDRAALNFLLSGATLPLKPWIEHPQLGSPVYNIGTRCYEINVLDETALDARIADVQNLAARFDFTVIMA